MITNNNYISHNRLIVLNTKAEVFQSFNDIASVINFLLRTGYLQNKTVIAIKSNNSAKAWDKPENLTQLQKEITEWISS
jgi:hypothetical protein